MRTIRMKHGGFNPRQRQDGRTWPPFNGTIAVGDEEALDLVTAGIAVYEEDEPVPVHDGFDTLKVMLPGYREPEPEQEDEFEDDEKDEEDAEDETVAGQEEPGTRDASVKRPYGNARKDVWVKYAISQGELPESARAMTKEELLQEYGTSI